MRGFIGVSLFGRTEPGRESPEVTLNYDECPKPWISERGVPGPAFETWDWMIARQQSAQRRLSACRCGHDRRGPHFL